MCVSSAHAENPKFNQAANLSHFLQKYDDWKMKLFCFLLIELIRDQTLIRPPEEEELPTETCQFVYHMKNVSRIKALVYQSDLEKLLHSWTRGFKVNVDVKMMSESSLRRTASITYRRNTRLWWMDESFHQRKAAAATSSEDSGLLEKTGSHPRTQSE